MNGYILTSKLKNGLVIPHWIGEGDEFYDKDTEAGHTFVIIEAKETEA